MKTILFRNPPVIDVGAAVDDAFQKASIAVMTDYYARRGMGFTVNMP